jgi:hypothetical protein
MRAEEFIAEARVSIQDQILADIGRMGGRIDDYFVRFTDYDQLGFSPKQTFGRSPDMDDPNFDINYIGQKQGRPALWFYPLKFWLRNPDSTYASHNPYVWLVRLKPNAWLQDARMFSRGVKDAPPGKERVGIMRHSTVPAAIFFRPGWQVVGKYYNNQRTHRRHGEVKGRPAPTFFDRVRGDA